MNVENILDNIATSVIITNKYMEIVHVNASGENFLRNSKEKLLNKKINDIFAKKNNLIINQIYDAIALGQSSISRDMDISLKSKIKHIVDCNVQAIYIDKEKHVLLEILQNQRHKSIEKNARFNDRNNATQMITRSIAHEIKNPLGGIRGAAQLLDYFINTSTKSIKVSAKSKGTANTLKMVSLVPTILNDSNLSAKHASSLEFRLMNTINSNNTNMGAIQGCALIGAISQQAAASVGGISGSSQIPNPRLFANLIVNDARLKSSQKITLRNIAYVCEKKIVEFSKKTMVSKKFTEIVKDVLDNEVFYVKLDIDNGIPKFNVISTSDRTISGIHFRNKNGYDSTSDKLGFKV